MKKARQILGKIALIVLILLLTVPFLIPINSSGTKTNLEAAGQGATFVTVGKGIIATDGVDVYYRRTKFQCPNQADCEPAAVFILLHGFGANTFSFREITTGLSEFGEVIAYDRPGFGFTERLTSWDGENPYGSPAQSIILGDLIKEFGAGKDVYLIGHSAGGTLAAQYALDNPDQIKGMILISPAILSTGGTAAWLNWIFSIPQLDRIGPLLVSSIASSGMELLYRSWFNSDRVTDEIIAGYRAPLQIEGWERAFWEFNRAPREFDVSKRLAEISTPTLLITGDTDEVVATADTESLATKIPGSILFVIPNSGHLAHEETPEETLKAIRVTWSILSR